MSFKHPGVNAVYVDRNRVKFCHVSLKYIHKKVIILIGSGHCSQIHIGKTCQHGTAFLFGKGKKNHAWQVFPAEGGGGTPKVKLY